MTKRIDCYGFQSTSVDYFSRKKQAVDIATAGNYTYIRFSTDEVTCIHRIEESDGATHIRWAYGAWTDRETLNYDLELNEAREIQA